jgi:murein DD-endopeptidase MepM/ murein hydrolase activator NlpD
MRKTFLFFVIILITMSLSAWQKEYCSEDTVCMVMEQNDSTVKVLFKNKLPMENQITTVTFEVKPKLENLKGTDRFPLTKVVQGPDMKEITSMTVIDQSKSWNSNLYFYWQYGSPFAGKEKNISYRLPFERGKKYRVCQAFNGKVSHFAETRYAVDFLMPIGSPVHAARDGIVIATEHRQEEGKFELSYRTKSNYVLIQHDDGTVGRYYHLVKNGVKVKIGQNVKAGELIGLSGNSGYSDVPHLHFEVSRPVDGKSKRTIPFTFVTDYSNNDVPVEGSVYVDNGLAEKRKIPVSPEDIVLCKTIKGVNPVDIAGSFSSGDSFNIFIPIDVPGVYSIKIHMYNEENKSKAINASWKTGKTWWYTSYPVAGKNLSTGKWKAEVSVNNRLLRILEFTLK